MVADLVDALGRIVGPHVATDGVVHHQMQDGQQAVGGRWRFAALVDQVGDVPSLHQPDRFVAVLGYQPFHEPAIDRLGGQGELLELAG